MLRSPGQITAPFSAGMAPHFGGQKPMQQPSARSYAALNSLTHVSLCATAPRSVCCRLISWQIRSRAAAHISQKRAIQNESLALLSFVRGSTELQSPPTAPLLSITASLPAEWGPAAVHSILRSWVDAAGAFPRVPAGVGAAHSARRHHVRLHAASSAGRARRAGRLLARQLAEELPPQLPQAK